MAERILIVDGDQKTINWLKARLELEGYVVEGLNRGDLAWSKIQVNPPSIVVLELRLPDMDGLELVRRVRQDPNSQHVGIIILSTRINSDEIAASLDAGADEYLMKRPGTDAELIAKIRAWKSQSKRSGAPSPSQKLGHLFSFCSAKGGTGTTSVCVNTGYALAKLSPDAEIVVIDMVLPMGTVGLSLGIKFDSTIARLMTVEREIDRSTVKKYVSLPLRWGFRVLVAANDPNESLEIDVTQIPALFQILRETYDYVLIDFGRMLSRISLPIIEMSTGIVLIVTPDMNTVHGTRQIVDYLELHKVSRNRLILVNNRTIGRVWTTTEDIEREVKLPLRETIPYEVEHMTLAINEGVPFMEKFPDKAAYMAITNLARQLVERAKQAKS
jgi:pilus assembly protein CpaE